MEFNSINGEIIFNDTNLGAESWTVWNDNKSNQGIQYILNEANALYDDKQFDQAYPLYKHLAVHYGNQIAWRRLGVMYEFGYGVEINFTEAAKCYEKAPDDALALRRLGGLCFNGQGTNLNYERAFELMEKSAEKGNLEALLDIGIAHYHHDNGKQGNIKAMNFCMQAAEKGNEKAWKIMRKLMNIIEEKDSEARSKLDHPRAAFLMGECYRNTEYFFILAKSDISRWYRLAPENGNGEDSYNIASHLISYGNTGDERKIRAHLNNAIAKKWPFASQKKLEWEAKISPVKTSKLNQSKSQQNVDLNESEKL